MMSNAEGPVFREPWEAQAFAIALSLNERGVFSSNEWAAVLGEEIKKAQAAGDPDTGETYYHHWLAALERLVAAKEGRRPKQAREGFEAEIIGADGLDIIAPRDGDAVFGAFKLRLQGEEVLVRFQVGIVFRQCEEPAQGPIELAVGLDGGFRISMRVQ